MPRPRKHPRYLGPPEQVSPPMGWHHRMNEWWRKGKERWGRRREWWRGEHGDMSRGGEGDWGKRRGRGPGRWSGMWSRPGPAERQLAPVLPKSPGPPRPPKPRKPRRP